MKVLNKNTDNVKDAVYIGRPSKWGNPFAMRDESDRVRVLNDYKDYLIENPSLMEDMKKELSGKDLACFCSPNPCHGDIIVQVCNGEFE